MSRNKARLVKLETDIKGRIDRAMTKLVDSLTLEETEELANGGYTMRSSPEWFKQKIKQDPFLCRVYGDFL